MVKLELPESNEALREEVSAITKELASIVPREHYLKVDRLYQIGLELIQRLEP